MKNLFLAILVSAMPAFAASDAELKKAAETVAEAYVHATWDETAEAVEVKILSRNAKVKASMLKNYQAEQLNKLIAVEVMLIDGGHDDGTVLVYLSAAGKVLAVIDGDSFTP